MKSAFVIVINYVILVLVIKFTTANTLTSSNFTEVLTDAAIAETVPRVAVSSKSNKADETGFASRNGFRDGGGYEELEVYGDSDKDKYGYATEVGFGKRTSSRDGKDPKVQDKHTYRKVSKLGNGFAPKSEQLKDIDIMDDATTLRKTVEEKPRSASYNAARSRHGSRGNNNNNNNNKRGGNRSKSKNEKEKEPSYEVVESVEAVKPVKSKKTPKKTPKSQRLMSYGPVLFDDEPLFSTEKKAVAPKKKAAIKKKEHKKEKTAKKPKKAQAKSARFTDIGPYDVSLENDGYGVFDEVDSAELDAAEYEGGDDYENTNPDYEEEGEAEGNNDYETEEAANAEENGEAEGDYEEGQANDDYEYEDGEANDYDEDSTGEHSNGSDDFREHYIYASEADKDATYLR